jgi:RNA polymerase sigma-70 factor (ECF subfamily)
VARDAALRGQELAARLAVPDRDEHVPRRDRPPAPARAADGPRAGRRPARSAGGAARRVGLDRAYPDELLPAGDAYASPEATYEQRESVELAFIAALQHLPARQRAVLILRAVLGFSAAEVADTLDTSVASVNSTLQRARRTVDERLPEHSQQATLRALGDERLREIVESYMHAMQQGDVDAVIALLTEEPTWSMPPMPVWYRGREIVAAFLTDHPLPERWRHVPTRANGQLAVGCYMWDDARASFVAAVIDVLTLRDDRIDEVTAFVAPWVYERFGDVAGVMTPAMFRRFGLPDELPA